MTKNSAATINSWLKRAETELEHIRTARLDALILLEFVTKHDRAFLLANGEDSLTETELAELNSLLEKRKDNTPIAYLTGSKEFYGLDFDITPNVLVPHPETEDIINLLLELKLPDSITVLDVGTGSGALAITICTLKPNWQVAAADISSEVLQNTAQNVAKHEANVKVIESNLLESVEDKFDVIVANLPYLKTGDARLDAETKHEPPLALYAHNEGLGLYENLFQGAKDNLTKNGHVIIESDLIQQDELKTIAKKNGFEHLKTLGLCMSFRAV